MDSGLGSSAQTTVLAARHRSIRVSYRGLAHEALAATILDVRGRVVRRASTNLIDARDDAGHPMAPGVYWIRVVTSHMAALARFVLLS